MLAATAFDIYKKAVRTRLDVYTYPNWPPTAPVFLGDYGQMLPDGTFHRLGNILDMGIAFEALESIGKTELTFSTAEEVSLKPKLSASGQALHAAEVHTAATIKFKTRKALFLKASGIRGFQIKNYEEVGSLLINRQKACLWKPNFVVVTKVHRAEQGTIAIANSNRAGGEIDFQVSGNLPISGMSDLLSADTSLTIQKSRNVSVAQHFDTANFLLEFSQLRYATFSFSSQPVAFIPRPNRGGILGGPDQAAVHIYSPPPIGNHNTGTATYLTLGRVPIL